MEELLTLSDPNSKGCIRGSKQKTAAEHRISLRMFENDRMW